MTKYICACYGCDRLEIYGSVKAWGFKARHYDHKCYVFEYSQFKMAIVSFDMCLYGAFSNMFEWIGKLAQGILDAYTKALEQEADAK